MTQGVRHIVAATLFFLTQDVVRQFVEPHAILLPQLSNIIYDMQNKKNKRKEYEAEVVKRKQGIEDARNERELRESHDQMQNSFVSEFESGELVH